MPETYPKINPEMSEEDRKAGLDLLSDDSLKSNSERPKPPETGGNPAEKESVQQSNSDLDETL